MNRLLSGLLCVASFAVLNAANAQDTSQARVSSQRSHALLDQASQHMTEAQVRDAVKAGKLNIPEGDLNAYFRDRSKTTSTTALAPNVVNNLMNTRISDVRKAARQAADPDLTMRILKAQEALSSQGRLSDPRVSEVSSSKIVQDANAQPASIERLNGFEKSTATTPVTRESLHGKASGQSSRFAAVRPGSSGSSSVKVALSQQSSTDTTDLSTGRFSAHVGSMHGNRKGNGALDFVGTQHGIEVPDSLSDDLPTNRASFPPYARLQGDRSTEFPLAKRLFSGRPVASTGFIPLTGKQISNAARTPRHQAIEEGTGTNAGSLDMVSYLNDSNAITYSKLGAGLYGSLSLLSGHLPHGHNHSQPGKTGIPSAFGSKSSFLADDAGFPSRRSVSKQEANNPYGTGHRNRRSSSVAKDQENADSSHVRHNDPYGQAGIGVHSRPYRMQVP